MIAGVQLKHMLVLLRQNKRLDALRMSYLMGYTPVRAEIASPETNSLINLGIKLNLLNKRGKYFHIVFPIRNENMGELSQDEIKRLKYLILRNSKVMKEVSDACSGEGVFNYDVENLLHKLLFELGLIGRNYQNYFVNDEILKQIDHGVRNELIYNPIAKEIGKFAEKVIFNQERARLAKNPEFLHYLEHTALKNDMAGYDIKSFDTKSKKEVYLEVKGTASMQTEFFLTLNEFNTAKKFGTRYKILVVRGVNLEEHNYKDIIKIGNPRIMLTKEYNLRPELFKVSKKEFGPRF